MEQIDWNEGRRNFYQHNRPHIRPSQSANIDKEVSHIVGKEVRVNDPRLIKFAMERRRLNEDPDNKPDIPLSHPHSVKMLRELFQ